MMSTALPYALGVTGLLLLVLLMPDAAKPAAPSLTQGRTSSDVISADDQEVPGPPIVSLVAIIADPMRFQGKEVVVAGFVDGDYRTLWMSRESLEYCIFANHMLVDLSKCENRSAFFSEAAWGTCVSFRGVIDGSRLDSGTARIVPVLAVRKFLWRHQRHVY